MASDYSRPSSRSRRYITRLRLRLGLMLLGQKLTLADKHLSDTRELDLPGGTFTVTRANGVEIWHGHR